jgi:hypothetical protein
MSQSKKSPSLCGEYEADGRRFQIHLPSHELPDDWEEMTAEQRWAWRDRIARRCGMPEGCTLLAVWTD